MGSHIFPGVAPEKAIVNVPSSCMANEEYVIYVPLKGRFYSSTIMGLRKYVPQHFVKVLSKLYYNIWISYKFAVK
jgi:hypothetical protein